MPIVQTAALLSLSFWLGWRNKCLMEYRNFWLPAVSAIMAKCFILKVEVTDAHTRYLDTPGLVIDVAGALIYQ